MEKECLSCELFGLDVDGTYCEAEGELTTAFDTCDKWVPIREKEDDNQLELF